MDDLSALLDCQPKSPEVTEHLRSLATSHSVPEIKAYPDAVYFNYYDIGISLLFVPADGYKPSSAKDLDEERLRLDSIDVYNAPMADKQGNSGTRNKKLANAKYSPYPRLPLVYHRTPSSLTDEITSQSPPTPAALAITAETTGKEFVSFFGEPTRKGGGTGPSSGSIGIWCEWNNDGLMVEFGGDEARGPQAWEQGKDAIWTVMTLFSKSSK